MVLPILSLLPDDRLLDKAVFPPVTLATNGGPWDQLIEVQFCKLLGGVATIMNDEAQWYSYQGRCSDGKESACNAGDPGSILRSGRSPGEGNGYLLQYSCLEKSMDRPAAHRVTKSPTQLSN